MSRQFSAPSESSSPLPLRSVRVIKLGGKVIDQPENLHSFLRSVAALTCSGLEPVPTVLVHGGGTLATAFSQRLGLPVTMIEGRRVTDAATMEVVQAVYAGLVNKNVVARLTAAGCRALGVSGADGDLIRGRKRLPVKGIDFGFVGDVDWVNVRFLHDLFQVGILPVIAPLIHDGHGQILNTNADTIAFQVAKSLAGASPVELIYAFEIPGVLADVNDPSTLLSRLTRAQFEAARADGSIAGGMIPKLENGFAAVDAGVGTVRICRWDQLGECSQEPGPGTVLSADRRMP